MIRLHHIITVIYGTSAAMLALCFMLFPQEAFDASIRGMSVWWEVVFPSLLPFFILSELLIRFGVISLIGTLFEPLMRPLFKVPGTGGFVWAMGLASGFPSGARLTSRLRQEGLLTQLEGERLVSFSNASSPLFIFGAVAVGFFHNAAAGLLLAASHYGGNLLVGLIMRFHGLKEEKNLSRRDSPQRTNMRHALKQREINRLGNKDPLGKIMGDAINSSIQTLLMIGGFMIFFSVLNEMLSIIRLTDVFSFLISIILSFAHVPKELSPGFIAGLFEITLGSQRISTVVEASLREQLAVTSFILAFNGFSVQAQVASIISKTDIRFAPFFAARCMHGLISALLAYLLFDSLYKSRTAGVSPFPGNSTGSIHEHYSAFISLYEWLTSYGSMITAAVLMIWLLVFVGKRA